MVSERFVKWDGIVTKVVFLVDKDVYKWRER